MVESANLEVLKYENHNANNYDFQVDNNVNIDPYTMFLHAMKSPVTKAKYSRRLEMFFDFLKIPGESIEEQCLTFVNNGRNNVTWVFTNILKFVLFHKERIHKKEISGATLINYLKAIKLFCEMSDLSINWKKITRGLSRGKRYANDRIPTLEEVRKIVEYPDRRIKPIVYTMCSSGIRLGAWDYLKWKHIIPILNDKNEIIAAKIRVYAEEEEEYISFISLEAYSHLKEWMNYRKEAGIELHEVYVTEDIEKDSTKFAKLIIESILECNPDMIISESYIGKYNLFTSTKFAHLLLSQLNYPIIIVRDYTLPLVSIITHIMMKITGNLGPYYLVRLMKNKIK